MNIIPFPLPARSSAVKSIRMSFLRKSTIREPPEFLWQTVTADIRVLEQQSFGTIVCSLSFWRTAGVKGSQDWPFPCARHLPAEELGSSLPECRAALITITCFQFEADGL